MIFTIPTVIHGNAMSRLLIMRQYEPPNGLGEIRLTQGRLADRTPGVAPTSTIQVTSLTALTDADKSKVIAAVSALIQRWLTVLSPIRLIVMVQ